MNHPARQIMILRHAKSDWHSYSISDFERPLNTRGIHNAIAVGQWINKHHFEPDQVICSPATRTRQTWQLVQQQIEKNIPVVFPDEMYLAGMKTLLQQLEQAITHHQRILLVGHNPGVEELLLYLCQDSPIRTRKGKIMATANLAILEEQDKLKAHSFRLCHLFRPAEN